MSEEWRAIPGFEGLYEVSSGGRVRGLRREIRGRMYGLGHLMTLGVSARGGYPVAKLCKAGRQSTRMVHALVAAAFIGPRPVGQEIRHLDGDPMNNRPENLAYGTRAENNLDAVRHGTHYQAKKTHCPEGHPYSEENTRVYRGRRCCRTCEGWSGQGPPGPGRIRVDDAIRKYGVSQRAIMEWRTLGLISDSVLYGGWSWWVESEIQGRAQVKGQRGNRRKVS